MQKIYNNRLKPLYSDSTKPYDPIKLHDPNTQNDPNKLINSGRQACI